jgi:uncharacterized protein YecE (DUF72 family)
MASTAEPAAFPLDALRARAAALAAEGVYVGTSSWKYEGWIGQLYTRLRYERNFRFAKKRFEDKCLAEYASVFRAVSVDATFYQFPSPALLDRMAAQVPEGFRFGLKATGEVTIRTFPRLPQHGDRAGERNERFLDTDLFAEKFLAPLVPHKAKVGLVMFEFSRFHERDFARGREFVEKLDGFLGKLPKDFAYAVEVRNASLLQPEYFAALKRNGVAHAFNSWTHMPPVAEQLAAEGSWTTDFAAARFLLTPGRSYEEAVKAFSPYTEARAPDPSARAAARAILARAKGGKRPSFVFVNNRLEGNALRTILAITEPGEA